MSLIRKQAAAERSGRRLAAKVRELAGQGTSRRAIGLQLELDRKSVRRVLAGQPTIRRRKRVDHDEIRRLYATGVTQAEIIRRLRTTSPTVRRALAIEPPVDAATAAAIVKLRREGKRYVDIASALEVSLTTISRALTAEEAGGPPAPAPSARSDDPDNLQRRRALEVLAAVDQERPLHEICRDLHVSQKSVYKLIAVRETGGIPTLRVVPPNKHALARQAERVEHVREFVKRKRPPGPPTIARRLGVAPGTAYADLAEIKCAPAPSALSPQQIAAQQRAARREERRREVRELAAMRVAKAAIALRLGVSLETIQNDLSNKPKRQWRRPELVERDRRARELYAQGVKVPEIAERLGTSAAAIWKDLRLGESRFAPARRRHAEIRRLVALGVSKKKIAARLKVSPALVYSVPKAPQPLLREKIAARAKSLRHQGISISAIERRLKVSRGTVERALVCDTTVPGFSRPVKRHPHRQRALQALDMLTAGISQSEICRRLHMSAKTVIKVKRAAAAGKAVTVRPRGKPDPVAARRLANQGMSQSAIARRLGTSRSMVRQILGIERPEIAPERIAHIRELSDAGHPKTEIARIMRMSLNDIYRVLPAAAAAKSASHRRGRQSRTVTPEQLAKELGVDMNEIHSSIERGEIAVIKLGRQVVIPRAAIVKALS